MFGSRVAIGRGQFARSLGGDKFFEAAGVRSLGALLRASVERQHKLTATLQGLLPKLWDCRGFAQRAANGHAGHVGLELEIVSGQFGTVCGLREAAADVACRQLE